VHFPEAVIKRQQETSLRKRSIPIQVLQQIIQRHRLIMCEEEIQVLCELPDVAIPVEVLHMRDLFIAHHVVVRNY